MRQIKYIDGYVAIVLVIALVIAACALFLSSCGAEARLGEYNVRLESTAVRDQWDHRRSRGLVDSSSLDAGLSFASPFEKGSAEVPFLFVWPRLPSVAEQHIKMANDRLRAVVQEMTIAKEEREQVSLHLAWESLLRALGEALLAIGIISVILALWSKGEPPKSDRHLT